MVNKIQLQWIRISHPVILQVSAVNTNSAITDVDEKHPALHKAFADGSPKSHQVVNVPTRLGWTADWGWANILSIAALFAPLWSAS